MIIEVAKKNILITGAAGFIGSSLATRLLELNEYFIVMVDNLSTGVQSNLPKGEHCLFINCDVNDTHLFSSLMNDFEFEYIFHYAAVVGVNRTIQNPKLVIDDIIGFQNVFSLAKKCKVKRVFLSSSSEIYGEPVHLPLNEYETPLNSRLPYAVVKNVGECFCRTYLQEYGIDYTILRFFNTYGAKQSPDFVISKFINQAIKGSPLTIYGDGSQTRTFCYIEDNVDFTVLLLQGNLLINEVVNVGSDVIVTIKELAELIIELTGSKSTIKYQPPLKEGDMTRRQPDISKMKAHFSRDLTELRAGISKILEQK